MNKPIETTAPPPLIGCISNWAMFELMVADIRKPTESIAYAASGDVQVRCIL